VISDHISSIQQQCHHFFPISIIACYSFDHILGDLDLTTSSIQ
jgi:hypothetical protein